MLLATRLDRPGVHPKGMAMNRTRHGRSVANSAARVIAAIFAVLAFMPTARAEAVPPNANTPNAIPLKARTRVEADGLGGESRVVNMVGLCDPKRTAFIVCDMWDLHHCLNATRRVNELAPRVDQLLKAMRASGSVIIHAPSDCMDTYKDHPARKRAQAVPRPKAFPEGIGQWCRQIPSEEKGSYPIDQSKGGEDDDPAEHARWAARLAALGRKPAAPWLSETDKITIDKEQDYVTDKGEEVWGILQDRGVDAVVLMGVHLNMCVLGRPFGLRQMAKNGKTVYLLRDLTDTMYDPRQPPYISHFSGTDRMVEHVERYVCPTVTSDQFVGGAPFRFRGDARPHVVFVVAEDEYKTEATLPPFARAYLGGDYRVSFVFDAPGDKNDLPGLEVLDDADLLFLSARRRVLPSRQLARIRRYVATGKPVVAIRTASHAFSARPGFTVPSGHEVWDGFDAEVLGGHYTGHHGEGPAVKLGVAADSRSHPILTGVLDPHGSNLVCFGGHGTLYKVRPLAGSATPLLLGTVPGIEPEPIAWTNLTGSGGRVFYTSLGHADDFDLPGFNRLLRNAVDWAVGRDVTENVEAASSAPIKFPGSK